MFFEIDNVQVGSIAFPNPAVANLPLTVGAVNGGAPSGASTLTVATIGLADTGRNAAAIADGTQTWRRATVKDSGIPAAKTDTGLVVALHPSSPLPGVVIDAGAITTTDVDSDLILLELRRISAILAVMANTYLDDDELLKE